MVNKDKNSVRFAKNNFYGLRELLSEMGLDNDKQDFRIFRIGCCKCESAHHNKSPEGAAYH